MRSIESLPWRNQLRAYQIAGDIIAGRDFVLCAMTEEDARETLDHALAIVRKIVSRTDLTDPPTSV